LVARVGLARAAAEAALRQGLRVPEDVAIVAGDDDPVLCELPPALSAIHYDYEELGWRAAQLLDRLMRGEPRPYKSNILIPPALVPRLSTDRASLGDPLVAKALVYIDSRRTERHTPQALAEAGRRCDRMAPLDVAAAMGVSLRTLEKRFRAARGRTVAQEIALARVAHAKLCLEEGLLPLRAIAEESGFGSYGAMLRAFRVLAGTTPDAVRSEAALRRQGAADAEDYRKLPSRVARTRLPNPRATNPRLRAMTNGDGRGGSVQFMANHH
ncbi:MAG: helix-turn-helix domain-containing protein, partial [Planctomycetes bacterium]|nr:helix-turn-helix domain-containing protein [Planctomycetota bacterium]